MADIGGGEYISCSRYVSLWNSDLVGIFGFFRFLLFLGFNGRSRGVAVVEVA